MHGWLALSPLLVFLLVYLVSSIVVGDFYKIPITSAFLVSSVYAVLISLRQRSVEQNIAIFSEGAGNRNVLLMLWIFVAAGAFAATARDIGAIDATVQLTLHLLPGRLLFAGLFLAACFISLAIGTSVGTIVALVPMAAGVAVEAGHSVPFVTAIVVGGAFFGDNLSFISDTTIAATRTQGCSMADKFRVNIRIVLPAAFLVCGVYVVQGWNAGLSATAETIEWVKVFPYCLIIILSLLGIHVLAVLTIGLITNAVIGFAYGVFGWSGWLGSMGNGIAAMGDLIVVTMLAAGMLEVIRQNGGLDFIISHLTRRVRSPRSAELSIAALVSLANVCTANNTIAIITTGRIAYDIAQRFGLDTRKVASILDTFSCLVQGFLPYGAQLLMAAALSGFSAMAIIPHLYYPFTMGACAILAIVLRYPRRYSR